MKKLFGLSLFILLTVSCKQDVQWFVFKPEKTGGISYTDQSHWLEAPAGKHGYLKMDSDHFIFQDSTSVKFWGVNICSEKPYSSNEEIDKWVENLRFFGINAVRFHKFSSHALTGNRSTIPDSALMVQFDYFHNKLKDAGIYYGWSPIYGHKPLPGDSAELLNYSEILNSGLSDHLKASTIGLVNFSEDIQNLQMKLIINLLNRKNSSTGLRYADDPALIFVEIQNEDNIYFATTQKVLETCPTYKALLARKFSDWLIQKYGTTKNLIQAWGEENFNFAREFSKDSVEWSLLKKNICPIANHGVFDYEYRKSVEFHSLMPVYLLDMLNFLYLQQDEFYSKAVKMIRSTGYKGAIVASCWQAGSGISHFYNLYNDYKTGIIDRHNYSGGGTGHQLTTGKINNESMLQNPGSGLLSTGMQKVSGRPFVFSEWMDLVPNEWTAEAVPLMACYGMGLQGWDGSFAFASNDSEYSPTMQSKNHGVYNVESPLHLGLYPAIANMIYRKDISEGVILGRRNVNPESLGKGILGFTELTDQSGDLKNFSSDLPLYSLAVGRMPVVFTHESAATTIPDLNEWVDTLNRVIKASNNQLEWHYGNKPYFTVNSPGTIGIVGFLPDNEISIGNVTIHSENEFAVILISCMNPAETIQTARQLLVTTIGRAKNTGMEYSEDHLQLLNVGTAPVLLEPVNVSLTFKGKETSEISVLNHLGYKTANNIKTQKALIRLEGEKTNAIYYLLGFN